MLNHIEPTNQRPCNCRTECNGHPVEQVGMKTIRYLWQGCKQTVFLWKQNPRSGEITGDKHIWAKLFDMEPRPLFSTPSIVASARPTLDDLPNIFGYGIGGTTSLFDY